jgi:hypothetical protein
MMNLALYHFDNNVNDQDALQQEMLRDCSQQIQDVQHCMDMVNNNIARIFRNLRSGMGPAGTCADIGECLPELPSTFPYATTTQFWPTTTTTPYVNNNFGDCRNCEFILSTAVYHFNNNIRDKAALQAQLLVECQQMSSQEGNQAAAHCQDVVYRNIDKIFVDLQNGVLPYQTCMDIGECSYPGTLHSSSHRVCTSKLSNITFAA